MNQQITALAEEPGDDSQKIQLAPPLQSNKKRGGQRGNTNAFRHGFYSRSFTRGEMSALDEDVKGEFHDELSVCRVNAARLAELMQDYKNMSPKDFIAASNALNNYLDHIRSLTRDQRFMYQNQTTIEKALQELDDLSPDED